MCLAIPARIVELTADGMAHAQVGESETYLDASVMLLPEPARIGDYIIVHAGFAIHRLDPAQAAESLRLLRQMATADNGQPAGF